MSAMKTSKERRKAPRAPSRLPLDIYDAKGYAVVAEGRFVNLSILGGRIVSRKPLKQNTNIRLQVVPVDKPVLDLAGKVVWARKKSPGFEYGIRFNAKLVGPAMRQAGMSS